MTSTDTGHLPSITTRNGSFLVTSTTTINPTTPSADVPEIRPSLPGRTKSGAGVDSNRVGVVSGTEDRRTLPGVGTYLIDTPRDAGLVLRQRLLSFQDLHRGLGKSQDEALPEIPFRLNPRPDPPLPPLSAHTMNHPQSILKADVATSPMPDTSEGDLNSNLSHTPSPAPSSARTVTFMVEPEVTPVKVIHAQRTKPKTVGCGVKRCSDPGSVAKFVSCSNRAPRKGGQAKTVRECTKVNLFALNGQDVHGKDPPPGHSHVTDRFPDFPDTTRMSWTLSSSKKKSSSLSDLTDMNPVFSLSDKDSGPTKRTRCFDFKPDSIGPITFLQGKKSKSLLDLSRAQDDDVSDLNSYHKRQRIAHLAFRRDNSVRRALPLSNEEADKKWMAMLNQQVVEKADYDKFASRRKPATPPSKKSSGKTYTPKSGVNFKISQPASGKVFPVFFNDGLPVRKFGHATQRRRVLKSKT